MCSLLLCFYVPLVLDTLSGLFYLHPWGPSLAPNYTELLMYGRDISRRSSLGGHLGYLVVKQQKWLSPKQNCIHYDDSSFKKRGNIYRLFMPFLLLWSHTVKVKHETLPSQPSLLATAVMSPLMMSRKKSAGLLWVSQVYPFKGKHALYRSCAD